MFNPKENSEIEQPEQILKLNPTTGYYEGIFTVRVEPEIFQRVLFTYVEEHHINLTDMTAWEKAIGEVARTSKWLSHPRARVEVKQEKAEVVEPSPINISEKREEKEKKPLPPAKSLTPEEVQVLKEQARTLPTDQWGTLLTPLPDEMKSDDPRKRPYYVRRHAEWQILDKLKEELYPVEERVEALAEAVNGNKLR